MTADDFAGTERFSVESRLGAGSFGVVYRAFDRKREGSVALKTLRRTDSDALYRFKQEFRSLADIVHPNLVTLYELLSDRDLWFFTMELVEGVPFLDHVRGVRSVERRDSAEESRPSDSRTEAPATASPGLESAAARRMLRIGLAQSSESDDAATLLGLERLRLALRQLAEGLRVLHRAGKLHRDIKPSNVLVTPQGRVVLLDFGLISDLDPAGVLHSVHLVGTPAYMSPEQAAGRPVTSASDWYGVGVMLYEALTGVRPFPGEYLDVLVEKQRSEPPSPRELCPSVPEDLSDLCSALLRRDPRDRPSGEEILPLIRAAEPDGAESHPSPPSAPALFVGRQTHLAELDEAFARTQEGRAIAVFVHGSSGVGKTALVRRFLEGPRRDEGTVILTGRCYQQETVPYKALDSLVDMLSRYLQRLPEDEAESLLPRDVVALTRLFPVLRQVEVVARSRRRVLAIPDSVEQRRRGFQALRELLGRVGARSRLILFIDDLQWGDADSAALLMELLHPPDPPPLLLIGCYRKEDEADSPLLKAIALRPTVTEDLEIRELTVGELSPPEAEQMARSLIASVRNPRTMSSEAIARESRGNPLFIDELVQYVKELAEPAVGVGASDDVSLDDVIWRRVSRLPDEAQRLLGTIAVAGRPLDRSTARRAAGLREDDQAALALLRTGRLLRGSGGAREDQIEIYHDRIRQTIIARLSPEARGAFHERLAFALESSSAPDPESLAVHYQGAGSRERAAVYAADAAAKAAEALAFDGAARLYKLALELGSADVASGQKLRVKLGDALANAGRGAEAAHAYLAAAKETSGADTLELQRRAAEQLLRSGHVDEGLAVLRKVLDRIGMRLPTTPRRALLSFLLRRVQLRLRGFSFEERAATEIPAEDLIRIDACWSVSAGLSLIDTIRGRDFQTRHVLLALKAGEPYRVARAIANEAGYTAYLGGWTARHRTATLVHRAMSLAERTKNPHAIGLADLNAGIGAYMEGRWEAGWDLAQRCEKIFREQCTGVAWELDTAHVYSLRALFFLGRLRELSDRLPDLLKEATERADLYAETSLRARHAYVVHLMADEPDRGRTDLRRAADQWSHQGFYLQHYFRLIGDTEISLYAGRSAAAREGIFASWSDLKRSLLLRTQVFRIESRHLRARCALAASASPQASTRERKSLLALAARDARRIEKEGVAWGNALATLLRAGIASLQGTPTETLERLAAAESGFVSVQMALYASAARRCRGLLSGGTAGHVLLEEADLWMRGERIRNPERMAAMLAPGRWSTG